MAETNYVMTLNVVSWVLASLVIIFTTTRILGRVLVIKQTGWDDLFMVIGALSAVVCSSLVTVGASHGLGTHQEGIKDPNELSEAIKYTVLAPIFSIVSSTSSKISILIFLFRLMGLTARRGQLFFLSGLCVVLVSLNLFAIVLLIRYCDPPEKQWQPSIPGTCINPRFQQITGFVQSGYNALMDIIVAIFPALFITKLNITRKMKIGLSILMGGSVFSAGATIVKVYLLKDLDKHTDITWYWARITLWYTAEMDFIIIAGTVPALWPLFKYIHGRGTQSYSHGIYKVAARSSDHPQGSEAFQLEGEATRALQEIDNMDTLRTWNGE